MGVSNMSLSGAQQPHVHLNRAEISGIVSDTLPPDELTRIEAHLQSCDDCRNAVVVERGTLGPNPGAATMDAPSPLATAAAAPPSSTLQQMSELLVRSGLLTTDEI